MMAAGKNSEKGIAMTIENGVRAINGHVYFYFLYAFTCSEQIAICCSWYSTYQSFKLIERFNCPTVFIRRIANMLFKHPTKMLRIFKA